MEFININISEYSPKSLQLRKALSRYGNYKQKVYIISLGKIRYGIIF